MTRNQTITLTVCLSLAVIPSALFGQASNADLDTLERDVARLAGKIDQLTYQLSLFAERFDQINRRLDGGALDDGRTRMPFAVRRGLKPPPNLLREVKEPTDWTAEGLRNYIDRVLVISDASHHTFANDPQIVMLARLGENNLDLLVEALGTHQYAADHHLVEAVTRLVRAEHKEYILEQLPLNKRLITVVANQGWEEDAADILLSGMSSGSAQFPSGWVEATARLDDPRVSDTLIRAMVRGRSPVAIYRALGRFDGLDLDRIVSETWIALRGKNTAIQAIFAEIAISHGIADALVFVARRIVQGERPEYRLRELRSVLKRSVDRRGTYQEIATWVLENQGSLWFDRATKRFVEE